VLALTEIPPDKITCFYN